MIEIDAYSDFADLTAKLETLATSPAVELGAWTPDVTVDASAEAIGNGHYHVTATVRNRGWLPTNVTDQGKNTNQDEKPVVVLEGGKAVSGRPRRVLDHLDGQGGFEELEWVVTDGDEVTVTVDSQRGVNGRATAELG